MNSLLPCFPIVSSTSQFWIVFSHLLRLGCLVVAEEAFKLEIPLVVCPYWLHVEAGNLAHADLWGVL